MGENGGYIHHGAPKSDFYILLRIILLHLGAILWLEERGIVPNSYTVAGPWTPDVWQGADQASEAPALPW